MSKVKTKIAMLQRIAPKHSRYGQLYRDAAQTKLAYRRVWFWTLYVSDDSEHMVRKHLFKKNRALTPQQWREWFSTNLDDIQTRFILPALAVRTDLSKQWAVLQYIGWTGDAKYAARHSATHRARNKTKRKR